MERDLETLYTDGALAMAAEMIRARRCGPAHYNLVDASRHLGVMVEQAKHISVLFKDAARRARRRIAVRARKLNQLNELFVRSICGTGGGVR